MADFVSGVEQDAVNLTFDGATFLLYAEPVAAGGRYGWPSDGTNYVWVTMGATADLCLKDGTKGGAETLIHGPCVTRS